MKKGIVIMSSWTSNGEKGLGHIAQWQSACLVCMKPQFPKTSRGDKKATTLHSFQSPEKIFNLPPHSQGLIFMTDNILVLMISFRHFKTISSNGYQ